MNTFDTAEDDKATSHKPHKIIQQLDGLTLRPKRLNR